MQRREPHLNMSEFLHVSQLQLEAHDKTRHHLLHRLRLGVGKPLLKLGHELEGYCVVFEFSLR